MDNFAFGIIQLVNIFLLVLLGLAVPVSILVFLYLINKKLGAIEELLKK